MTQLRSEFLREITQRGYMHQCTDLEALDRQLVDGIVPAYIGG
jgi:tyrosyl-tRNA synthetase